MDHAAHEPGTVPDCPECRGVSYEPGWYRSLLEDRASRRDTVVIPDAEQVKIVLPDAELPNIAVPDLEETRSEDEER
jgi:hypothetical protein